MLSRELSVLRALPVLVLVVFMALPAVAQDVHLSQDTSAKLYAASPYAHGYRHGYEEGYHAADMELHLSRFSLADLQVSSVPKAKGYKREFGSKPRFESGFKAGYLAGYEDSAASRQFRMVDGQTNALVMPDKEFDDGVAAGATGTRHCDAQTSQAFCSGVRVGRALGNHPAKTEVAAAISDGKN